MEEAGRLCSPPAADCRLPHCLRTFKHLNSTSSNILQSDYWCSDSSTDLESNLWCAVSFLMLYCTETNTPPILILLACAIDTQIYNVTGIALTHFSSACGTSRPGSLVKACRMPRRMHFHVSLMRLMYNSELHASIYQYTDARMQHRLPPSR
jgi:hypothetical protein